MNNYLVMYNSCEWALILIACGKAIPSFIFVSRPREGRFLAFPEEKKNEKMFLNSYLFHQIRGWN